LGPTFGLQVKDIVIVVVCTGGSRFGRRRSFRPEIIVLVFIV
jgi:hypothetical protein